MADELDVTVKVSCEQEQAAPSFVLPGRYEDRGLIGKGGMGAVYRAYDKTLGRDVAIKIVRLGGADDNTLKERFLREAKMLGLLEHPAIVKLLTWGLNDLGNLYLVMEFLDGIPLSKEIGDGKKLTPTRFHEVFSQILAGLSYAHDQGIVHRDLKPSNIILFQQQNSLCAKIIDFGLARIESGDDPGSHGLTKTGVIMGSPTYMSPEQCKGGKADRLSDIYSIGCIMFESVFGDPPHMGESAMEVMYKHMNAPAMNLGHLAQNEPSRRLARLIESCLSKDPAQRPQGVEAVQAEINQIFKKRIDTGKLFAPERGRNPGRLKNTVPVICISVIVIIAAVIFCLRYHSQSLSGKSASDGEFESRTASHIQVLRRNMQDGMKSYEKLPSGISKSNCARDLYDHTLKDLLQAEMRLKHYQVAEEDLRRWGAKLVPALPVGQEGDIELGKAVQLMNIADIRLRAGQIKGVDVLLSEADKCIFSNTDKKAFLAYLHTKYSLMLHNYNDACDSLKILTQRRYALEIDKKRRLLQDYKSVVGNRFGIQPDSDGKRLLEDLLTVYKKHPPTNIEERIEAIEFLTVFAESSIRPGYRDSFQEAASLDEQLILQLPADKPEKKAFDERLRLLKAGADKQF